MRPLMLALLLIAWAPGAAAQDDAPLVVTIDAFPAPAMPLGAPVATNVTVDVSCTLLSPGPPPRMTLTYEVVDAPAWAVAVVSPEQDAVALEDCEDGRAVRSARVLVSANVDAPAFRPDALVVRASVVDATGQTVAQQAQTHVAADYFSILDASVAESIRSAAVGERIEFLVTLENHGNGPTRVSFELTDPDPVLEVVLPEPVLLDSRQTGGPAVSRDVVVGVTRVGDGVAAFALRFDGAHAEDATLAGDDGTLSFLVQPEHAQGRDRETVPAPGLEWLLAALAPALLRARQR